MNTAELKQMIRKTVIAEMNKGKRCVAQTIAAQFIHNNQADFQTCALELGRRWCVQEMEKCLRELAVFDLHGHQLQFEPLINEAAKRNKDFPVVVGVPDNDNVVSYCYFYQLTFADLEAIEQAASKQEEAFKDRRKATRRYRNYLKQLGVQEGQTLIEFLQAQVR